MNPYDDRLTDKSTPTIEKDVPAMKEEENPLPEISSEIFNESPCVMPQTFEIVSENIGADSQENMLLPSSETLIEQPVRATDDLSFLVSEDSIVLSEAHFEPLAHFPEHSIVSPSFSRSRQLLCDDSLDSPSRDAAPLAPIFHDCQETVEDEDYFLTTSEEASMDSGLGSVESAYVNSEEENVLSPDGTQVLAPSQGCEVTQPLQTHTVVNTVEPQTLKAEVFHDCLPDIEANRILKKREHEPELLKSDQPAMKKQKTEKKVSFKKVTVFYFPRKQGFVSVPSQGGSTLGMDMRHADSSTMTIQEHHYDTKQRHKQKVREHWTEQKIENKIKQLKFMNPELDNGTLSSMAQSAVSQADVGSSVKRDDDAMLYNFDEFFFLQPISAKKRRKILRSAGVDRIDGEEKLMNRILRESREMCGCSCEEVCIPDTCECALSGIQCQVDRESFPCGCLASGCQNENGRIEFDAERVRNHLLGTLEKLNRQEEDTDSQRESAASSESECDFMSSDDAEQSDLEVVDSCENLQPPEADCAKDCLEEITKICDVEDTKIPQEYLNILGLKRVQLEMEPDKEVAKSVAPHAETVPLAVGAEFLDSDTLTADTLSYSEYSYPNSCLHKSMESLAQSIPDPPPQLLPRQMYGTTSPDTYCQGAATSNSRDLSISLDPIATFMTATYNVATESITCSSNC